MGLALLILAGWMADGTPTVVNPGFEQLTANTRFASGWSYTSLPGLDGLVRYECKSEGGEGDSLALWIVIDKAHPKQQIAYNAHQLVSGCQEGKSYEVSARFRRQGLKVAPMIVVQCSDAAESKMLGIARSPVRNLDRDVKEWERIATTVTIPAGTEKVRLRIGIPTLDNIGGTAILDDVEVKEIKL